MEHNNQLDTYRDMAQEWCSHADRGKNWKLVCVYLKTGNESASDLAEIREKQYRTINRADLTKLFKQHDKITSDIFTEFMRYLDSLEAAVSGFMSKPWSKWQNQDWEGFYVWMDSQEEIWKMRWFWVNNVAGGFWAFLMNWEHKENTHPLYIQIESAKGLLCIKISLEHGGPKSKSYDYMTDAREQYYNYVMRKAKEAGLKHIQKPARFGRGAYMTVAVVKPENWLGSADKPVEFDQLKGTLNTYNAFVQKCAAEWPAQLEAAEQE